MIALAFASCVLTFSLHNLCPHPDLLFATALISRGAWTLFCKAFKPFSINSSSPCAVNFWLRPFFLKDKSFSRRLNLIGILLDFPCENLSVWGFNWFWVLALSPGRKIDCCLDSCLIFPSSLKFEPSLEAKPTIPPFASLKVLVPNVVKGFLWLCSILVIAGDVEVCRRIVEGCRVLLLGSSLNRCTPLSRKEPEVWGNEGSFFPWNYERNRKKEQIKLKWNKCTCYG